MVLRGVGSVADATVGHVVLAWRCALESTLCSDTGNAFVVTFDAAWIANVLNVYFETDPAVVSEAGFIVP